MSKRLPLQRLPCAKVDEVGRKLSLHATQERPENSISASKGINPSSMKLPMLFPRGQSSRDRAVPQHTTQDGRLDKKKCWKAGAIVKETPLRMI